MTFTKAQVREMHRLYTEEFWPLEAVGEKFGVSREKVRQLFNDHNLAVRARGISPRVIQNLEKAQRRHDAIIEAYKEIGNLPEVALQFELPQRYISMIVDTIPDRRLYRHRDRTEVLSDDDLLEAIRRAADLLGEPLMVSSYNQMAAVKLKLPAHSTILLRFGSWANACRLAGVKPGETRKTRRESFDREACLRAIRRSRTKTYDEYVAWAKGHKDRPSGATVRNKLGGWASGYREANSA